jgi:hypothetical protein
VLPNQAPKKPLRSRALGPTNAKGLVGYPLRLAHQTCCDMSGRARPSRRRHYQRGLTPLMLSQPLANPKKPPSHHQRGLTPLMLLKPIPEWITNEPRRLLMVDARLGVGELLENPYSTLLRTRIGTPAASALDLMERSARIDILRS